MLIIIIIYFNIFLSVYSYEDPQKQKHINDETYKNVTISQCNCPDGTIIIIIGNNNCASPKMKKIIEEIDYNNKIIKNTPTEIVSSHSQASYTNFPEKEKLNLFQYILSHGAYFIGKHYLLFICGPMIIFLSRETISFFTKKLLKLISKKKEKKKNSTIEL